VKHVHALLALSLLSPVVLTACSGGVNAFEHPGSSNTAGGGSEQSSSGDSGSTSGNATSSTPTSSAPTSSAPGSGTTGNTGSGSSSSSGNGAFAFEMEYSVSGLSSSGSLVVTLNGSYARTITANGSYYFVNSQGQGVGLVPGQAYTVAITAQPTGQTCSVSGGSGTVGSTTAPPPTVVSCSASATTSSAKLELAHAGGPAARTGAATWTDQLGALWLFGGQTVDVTQATYFDDTWTLGVSGAWRLVDAQDAPAVRSFGAMWYDTQDRAWLFGGKSESAQGTQVMADLYYFSANTGTWVAVAPVGVAPAARYGAQTSVDAQGRLWLFGGENTQGVLADTWYFDVRTLSWVQQAASVSP
jgi:hypothetical protein